MISKELILNQNVKYRWENNNTILLNTLLPMNRLAGIILDLFNKNSFSEDEIINIVVSKYNNISKEIIKNDIKNFLHKLIALRILIYKDNEYDTECSDIGMNPNFSKFLKKIYNNTLSAPTRVSCKITSLCNAKCLHCYASKDNNDLTYEEWTKIFDILSDLNVFSVTFTGGDPLCRRDIVKLVDYCSKKQLKTTIVTNGLALNEDLAKELKNAGISAIYQSLDGAHPETHDKFRQVEGLFNKVLDNIELLEKENINTAILTTINKLNLTEIEEIVDLIHSKKIKLLSFMKYITSGNGKLNSYLKPTIYDYKNLIPIIYRKSQEYKDIIILYPDIPVNCYISTVGLDVYNNLKKKGIIGSCSAGISTIAINSDGRIKICDISEDLFIGNILYDDFRNIWLNSPILKRIRGIDKINEYPCSNCNFNNLCISGCRGFDYQLKNNEVEFKSDLDCYECYESIKE
ncbi:hypothetical protein BFT35_08500 [Thermoanaerobacterium thermosaccharolyticum]|uniref:radical SAM protein n=1 Tax=Thermoanaerobacterium thermosaccharolyticum TaxID=1517 RepID=UPI000C088776|nr:PqqD family peptide modification chaperone [Thermoanaerobacterium thermosaccharolyticum]PHO06912.1 hypothetical protein BFT35_08500 [Thermoanaerobacterium thermosaccharolyticum]